MVTKLKNLLLTSVDLVRRGANQEADICLAKSDDDTAYFQAFVPLNRGEDGWPYPVEKRTMDSETALVYTGALAKSIQSIQEDDSLDADAKAAMIRKSFEQFNEAVEKFKPGQEEPEEKQDPPQEEPVVEKSAAMYDMIEEIESKPAGPVCKGFDTIVEIEKFNDKHDPKTGRFAPKNGGGVSGGASPIKVNGPKDSKEYADRYLADHPEVAKEVEKYKNVLDDVQNFQKNHPDAEEGTYSAVTGELVNPTGGFAVTFHQNLTKDNPYGGYDSDTYAKMCAIAKHQLGSEDVYIGFFGNAEVSFNCASKDQAMKFAQEHNQHSIFDCSIFDTIVNKEYNPVTNPIEGHE